VNDSAAFTVPSVIWRRQAEPRRHGVGNSLPLVAKAVSRANRAAQLQSLNSRSSGVKPVRMGCQRHAPAAQPVRYLNPQRRLHPRPAHQQSVPKASVKIPKGGVQVTQPPRQEI